MSVCKVIEFVCVKSLLSFLVSFVCIGYVRNRKDLSPAWYWAARWPPPPLAHRLRRFAWNCEQRCRGWVDINPVRHEPRRCEPRPEPQHEPLAGAPVWAPSTWAPVRTPTWTLTWAQTWAPAPKDRQKMFPRRLLSLFFFQTYIFRSPVIIYILFCWLSFACCSAARWLCLLCFWLVLFAVSGEWASLVRWKRKTPVQRPPEHLMPDVSPKRTGKESWSWSTLSTA